MTTAQCTALNLSDESPCNELATSINRLFCSFHSRQCQGLYRGYKVRNARLDVLDANPPVYLATNKTPLANETFEEVDTEETLREIHDHLALKYALLDRVIRAQKLHHSRFFSLNLDYGHENYLNILSSRRFIVVRALERLERRVGEVLYKKQKWFKKTLKRQEAFLDEAYNSRLSEEEQEAEWDPIEDVITDERGNYIDLIKHILLLTESVDEPHETKGSNHGIRAEEGNAIPRPASPSASVSKKSKKSKSKVETNGANVPLPEKSAHDTKSQVRDRLRNGVRLYYGSGLHIAGTVDNPRQTHDKTAPVPDEEIDRLLVDMAEIKHLLFCRLLLSQATVLPAAIRASSVDEFLSDPEVTDTDLRDLALKLDNPGLQEIRDACADLGRGDEEEDGGHGELDEEIALDRTEERLKRLGFRDIGCKRDGLPRSWAPEREKQAAKGKSERQALPFLSGNPITGGEEEGKPQTMIDFGDFDDERKLTSKRMRVRICGRYIYNYPSERAVSRGSWLQFCLIAKDSDLHDAIKLCRHWDEFFALNILAIFQYFPAAKWLVWKGDHRRKQLLQLGLIPYMEFGGAQEMTTNFQTGSRGQMRRAHSITESRNFICANIKRNDPATRRFLQYLTMRATKVVMLVRDAKTSQILRSPPKTELWLHREKAGIGRASTNEWTIRAEVGEKFFEKMEKMRQWHFGFNEYYDVYMWDLEPGKPFARLYNTIYETLFKAHRFCSMQDMFNPAASILKTLTHDPDTFRTRDLKPDEESMSIWEEVQRGRNRMLNPEGQTVEDQIAPDLDQSFFYGEADMLEDEILFPEGFSTESSNALYSGTASALEGFGNEGPNWERFIHDLETDEELESDEDDEEDESEDEADEDNENMEKKEQGVEEDEWEDYEDERDHLPEDRRKTTASPGVKGKEDPTASKPSINDVISSCLSEEEQKDLMILSGWEPPKDFRVDVKADFNIFCDREKSRAFKKGWHAADFHPNGPERWQEAQMIISQMKKFIMTSKDSFKHLYTIRFLNVHPDRHRRVTHDALEARAMALLFFPSSFLISEQGLPHKDSLLLNQHARAIDPPLRRPFTSDAHKPRNFWDEFDTYWRTHSIDEYPQDWDIAIRPIIARLYKAGIVGPTFTREHHIPGKAVAVPTGPDGARDLYIDLRLIQPDITFEAHVRHPPSKQWLLTQLHTFARTHPRARFSALRLWSAPHFYPLMLGWDRRTMTTFTDGLGRGWEWLFVPKDMPFSETSLHTAASARLAPFRTQFADRVLHMRDLFVVMGVDEEDALKMTTAVVFAVTGEPWRLEMDLWRSFVNVDVGFLDWVDGMGVGWLD
ncbi:MAG: hypothetical protein Q9182_005307 [Xanthomendoza sp. 2 TL-2023]